MPATVPYAIDCRVLHARGRRMLYSILHNSGYRWNSGHSILDADFSDMMTRRHRYLQLNPAGGLYATDSRRGIDSLNVAFLNHVETMPEDALW